MLFYIINKYVMDDKHVSNELNKNKEVLKNMIIIIL
jgi:hypothetical protein